MEKLLLLLFNPTKIQFAQTFSAFQKNVTRFALSLLLKSLALLAYSYYKKRYARMITYTKIEKYQSKQYNATKGYYPVNDPSNKLFYKKDI